MKLMVALIFAVLLGLLSLESALRYVNYGHDVSYVIRAQSPVGPRAILNPGALLAYTSLGVVNSSKEAYVNIPVEKPDNSIRVVVLGGSAAYGPYHAPDLSLARYLEAMLAIRFPELAVDVINLAFPSLNSGANKRILQDALFLKPDMVVYYGAVNDLGRGIIMQMNPLPPRLWFPMEELLYGIKRLKIHQLAVNCAGKYFRRLPAAVMGDRYDEFRSFRSLSAPVFEAMTDAYRANIREIVSLCRKNEIPVFLGTFAHNMKNLCTADPFPGGTSLEQTKNFLPLLQRAYDLELAGEYRAAIDYYEKFHRALPWFADPLCRLAFCYQALDRPEEAAAVYGLAKSLSAGYTDALEALNRVLRDIAGAYSGDDVFLVDIAGHLQEESPLGFLADETWFTDIIHFNAEGSYAAAAEVYRSLVPLMSLENFVVFPPTKPACEQRMGVTGFLKQSLMESNLTVNFVWLTELMGRPPMSHALMHDIINDRQLKAFIDGTGISDRSGGPAGGPAGDPDEAADVRDRFVSDNPDYYFYKHQISLLQADNRSTAAAKIAGRLVDRSGRHSLALILYGQALLRDNQPEAALEVLVEVMGHPARAYDLGVRLSGARVAAWLGRREYACDILEAGKEIIEHREPADVYGNRTFSGFKQNYLSTRQELQCHLPDR